MLELPETRNSLLVRLSAVNDTTAWAAFLRIYEPTIYRIARSRGLQDSDARDVTQEVLLAVHDKIDDWEYDSTKGSFRGWLFRVLRNCFLKSRRDSCLVNLSKERLQQMRLKMLVSFILDLITNS